MQEAKLSKPLADKGREPQSQFNRINRVGNQGVETSQGQAIGIYVF